MMLIVSRAGLAVMAAVTLMHARAADAPAPARATPLFTTALPDLAGKEGMMLTVEYAPGGASPAHRHNANTFVYVLEGSVVMQVAGGEEKTLKVGDVFYESPADIHSVSRNASSTQPAKILVVFIKDAGAPVSVVVEATEG